MNRILQISLTYSSKPWLTYYYKPPKNICSFLPVIFNSPNRGQHAKVNDPEFKTIYKLPLIQRMAAISLSKKFYFLAVGASIPISGWMEYAEMVSGNAFLFTSYFGISSAICFSLLSWIFKGTIGFIYVSPDTKTIKVSTLDWWGKRVDTIMPTNDWVPLSELPPSFIGHILLCTQRYSCKQQFKIYHRHGEILDRKVFQQVIGLA